ncbi:MAG: hypothetical protein ACI9J5_002127 [Paraglaciecola sp.]|jgi:hypothetical protein
MILRHVIKHFRNQEWTAIAIDFVIVVVGVFVGIQVANWNQAQNDMSLGTAYLKRIQLDVETDIVNYNKRMAFWDQVIKYGSKALAFAEGRPHNESTDWEMLLAFFQASQISEFYSTLATYNELTNAGDLRLLGNVAIRNAVTNYYTNSYNPALSERPKYRENVRGLISINIQTYIWQHCHTTDVGSNQRLVDCDPPPELANPGKILNSLAANQTLLADLRYWISTQTVATKIGLDRIVEAERLKILIESELKADK